MGTVPYDNDTHVAATVTLAVIQPTIPTFHAPEVALLVGELVPLAVEVEDEVGDDVLHAVSVCTVQADVMMMLPKTTGTVSSTYLVAFVAVEHPEAKVTGLAGRAAHVL